MQRARVDKPRRPPHPRQADTIARPDCFRCSSPLFHAHMLPDSPGLHVSTRPAVWRCVAPATSLTLVSEAEGHGAVAWRRTHVLGCQPASGELGEARRRAGRAPRALPGRSAGSQKTERERWPGCGLALRRSKKRRKKMWRKWRKKAGANFQASRGGGVRETTAAGETTGPGDRATTGKQRQRDGPARAGGAGGSGNATHTRSAGAGEWRGTRGTPAGPSRRM